MPEMKHPPPQPPSRVWHRPEGKACTARMCGATTTAAGSTAAAVEQGIVAAVVVNLETDSRTQIERLVHDER